MAQRTPIDDLIIALGKFAEHDGVCPDTIEAAIEFAKNRLEMQKQQTIDAYKHGQNNGYSFRYGAVPRITGEEYYNQTYKTT